MGAGIVKPKILNGLKVKKGTKQKVRPKRIKTDNKTKKDVAIVQRHVQVLFLSN